MKKSLLSFFIVFIAGIGGLYAQSCTPNPAYTSPGYYPDSIPHAFVGQMYSGTIQARIPLDTSIATVDSIDVTGIAGLPGNFTKACSPSSCHFPGGSNACINIYSTVDPTGGMIGSYPLQIFITTYANISGTPLTPIADTITSYTLHVDAAAAGIYNLTTTRFDLSQNFPDPANKYTNIYYSLPAASKIDFKVYNLLGKIVYQKSYFADGGIGKIPLDTKDFAPGIYMYNLSNGKATLTKRMVIASN